MRAAPRFTTLVGVLMAAAFALRLWSASRWSWYADDWVYLHDAATQSFLSYVTQVYQGHLMPGQFAISWVMTAIAPLDHDAVALVTALWAAGLVALWAVALRDLWGTGPVTWAVLLLVTLSPLQVLPAAWWASALQALAIQTCLGACLFFAARLIRTDGAAGTLGLVVSFAVGLLMWQKAVLLALPVLVVLLHATPGPLLASLRRYRRVAAWLVGLGVGYALVFLLASSRADPDAPGAVHLELGRSPGEVGRWFYDLAADLLAPGVWGGPWNTLPNPEQFASRPPLAVSVAALVALAALVGRLLRRDRRAWLPLLAALVYAAAAWGSILFSNRFDVTAWHRFTYERYAVDAFVVLVLLLGAAAVGAPPAEHEDRVRQDRVRQDRASLPAWVAPAAVGLLVVSLGVGSVTAVLRLADPTGTKTWLANVERGVAEAGSVTLVDRHAPDSVMAAVFWGDRAKLSYLLAPWDDVEFGGPAAELRVVQDDGRVVRATFAPAATAPAGPVPECGYAVEVGAPQTVDLEPDLFDLDWVVKVEAFAASAGTLLVRVDGQEIELPVPSGLSSSQVVFTGTVDTVELEMAEGSGTACVTDLAVGTLSPAG